MPSIRYAVFVLQPQITWTATQFQDYRLWRDIELVEDPQEPIVGICAEALVQLDAGVQVVGVLILMRF